MPETALGLSAFRDALREAYGDKYYPDTKLTEDEIRSELGMDDSLYEEVYAENTAQKAHPDTFIAVKVKEHCHAVSLIFHKVPTSLFEM